MTTTKPPSRPSTPRFALLVLLGAYPVITMILYLLAPLTIGWAIWQKTLLVAPMMVATMVWGVIPIVHKHFQRFIAPAANTLLKTIALAAGLTGAFGALAQSVSAQPAAQTPSRWEFSVPSGQLLPTGEQRATLKRADHTALQLSWLARPSLAVTTTVGWARSRDISATDAPRLDVLMYDIGAEVRGSRRLMGAMAVMPFAGLGAGGRSYDYRGVESRATHNLAAGREVAAREATWC